MPHLSTRGKLLVQVDKAMASIDDSAKHLQTIDMIANGLHPKVTGYMPSLIKMLDQVKTVLRGFRSEL